MQPIDVAAGLVFRGGKLLLTQRHPAAHLGGLWEFPGGKREPEETFEQCLVRELREELGIEVEVGELVESITHTYPEKGGAFAFLPLRMAAARAAAAGLSGLRVGERCRTGRLRFSGCGRAAAGETEDRAGVMGSGVREPGGEGTLLCSS